MNTLSASRRPARSRPERTRFVCSLGAALLLAACGGGGGSAVIGPYWVPSGLVVQDLDGDGRADVAVARTYLDGAPPHAGYVDVRRQTVPGRFAATEIHPVAADPWTLSVADTDGDARPDLLTASPLTLPVAINGTGDSGAVSLLRQDPLLPGRFQPAQVLATGGMANEAGVADVNADGRADLLVADGVIANSRARLLTQQAPGGVFNPPTAVCAGSGSGWASLAAGDVDNDGVVDIAGAGGTRAWWCRGLGGGAFGAPSVLGLGASLGGVVLADLDGNGRLDVAVADAGLAPSGGTGGSLVTIWLQSPAGTFGLQTHAVADGARRLAVADLDQDGRLDIAVVSIVYQTQGNSTRVTLLRQSAMVAGTFSVSSAWQGPMAGNFLATGDVTGDGLTDIVVNDSPTVYAQSATVPGVFLPGTVLP